MVMVAVAGGTYAFHNSTVEATKSATVYTYYMEDHCSTPVLCSPEFNGNVCELEFAGSVVYDQPGCLSQNRVETILGKKQP